MLTAGLRWAPDTLPMNRMTPSTIRAGAVTAARPADGVREGLPHHAAAGGHQDQEEGAEQFGEQPAPFLRRVVEVLDHRDELSLQPRTRDGVARNPRASRRSLATLVVRWRHRVLLQHGPGHSQMASRQPRRMFLSSAGPRRHPERVSLRSFMPASSPSAMSSHPVCGSRHHAPRRPNTNTQPRRHALAPAVSTRDAGSPLTPKCSPSPARAVSGPSDVEERREPPSTPDSVFAGQAACIVSRVHVRTGGADESACKPDPVPGRLTALRSATIHLGLPSPTGSSGLPAGSDGPPSNACAAARLAPCGLLTLLRVGFTEPPRSPGVLVVSYTTVSPLPRAGGAGRSVFCGTVPRVAPGCR